MKHYILGLDQGTTGNTAILLDETLNIAAQQTVDFPQHYPKAGWVEHDCAEIWTSMQKAIAEVLTQSNIKPNQIAGIGITNQRETTVLWDKKTGDPIHPAIVWQCKRSLDICQNLKSHESDVHQKTGLFLDPYFSASKIAWLLQNVSQAKTLAQQGQLAFGSMDSFLIHRLTSGSKHLSDVSNASRTLLMNLRTLDWDDDLLALFNIPKSILPKICSSSAIVAHTKGLTILPDGIPIAGIAGDQQAALFGQACFAKGDAKCTYGTGAFLLQNTGEDLVLSDQGLLSTVAWRINDQTHYALEGSVFIAGAAVTWLRDGLGIIDSAKDIEALAKTVTDSDGVQFIPCFSGLGAPFWQPNAKASITGLHRGSHKGHIAYACLQGIAQQVCDLIAAFEKTSGQHFSGLKVDGGASQNQLLMQMQSNLLGIPLHQPQHLESTAMGACFLAGLAIGLFADQGSIQKQLHLAKHFKPQIPVDQKNHLRTQWELTLKNYYPAQ